MKLTLRKGHALVVTENGAEQVEFESDRHDADLFKIGRQDQLEYAEGDDVYAQYGDDGTIYGPCHVVAEANDPWDLPLPASLALVDPKDLKRSALEACMPIFEYAQEQGNSDIMSDFQYLMNIWGRLPYVYPHLNGRTGREAQDALVAKYLADRKGNLAMMLGQIGDVLDDLSS